MMTPDRLLASLSFDLDDLWTYLRTHGDPSWSSRRSYLETVVPLALDALDQADVRLTFFVVGSDAASPRNAPLLRGIIERGHEIGNHSFEHEPWLHRLSPSRLQAEVIRTQDALAQVTGQKPIVFRGPGYSWSPELFELLERQGYLYDASTLPTYLGPIARRYYFWTSPMQPAERAEREALFGKFQDGLRPIKAYRWCLPENRTLLEIPVTTFPLLKLPFHLSYLHYLSRGSEQLALGYLRAGLLACKITSTSPSFILHPLDIIGADTAPELAFFPGMTRSSRHKMKFFHRVLQIYRQSFSIVPMGVHARALLSEATLALRQPRTHNPQSSILERDNECAAS